MRLIPSQRLRANTQLKLVAPTTEIRTVPAGRKTNAAYRSREHLTEAEVEKLIEAARANRHGHRDALMVLVAYREKRKYGVARGGKANW